MDQHRISRLQRDLLCRERVLEILRRDFVRLGQHWHTLEGGDVEQDAAGEQGAHLFDAQPGEPSPAGRLVERDAVVHARPDHLVAERVELGADLSDLGHDQLLVRAAAVASRIVAGALRDHLEAAACRQRHRFGQDAAQLEYVTGTDQPRGLEHSLRLHVVAGAALVRSAPLRRAALVVGRRLPPLRRRGGADAQQRCQNERGSRPEHNVLRDRTRLAARARCRRPICAERRARRPSSIQR